MNKATIELEFSDGESTRFVADNDLSLVDAARQAGVRLATDCLSGTCQTCKCDLVRGEVGYDDADEIALEDNEREAGAILPCQARPISSEIKLRLSYTRASQFPPRTRKLRLSSISRVSDSVYEVRGGCQGGKMFPFLAGQYVNLKIPGADTIRSFSMMTAPGQDEIGFLIRTISEGAMSNYLTRLAKVGDVLQMTGPFGTFYRRRTTGPRIMVAGGTGLAPILSILRDLQQDGDASGPIVLAFGVNSDRDAFYHSELGALMSVFDNLKVLRAARTHSDSWQGRSGTAVDLLDSAIEKTGSGATVYLCGPPPMVESARSKLLASGVDRSRIFAEEFQPSGLR
jgi:benzoate/toluate 1,2-dioxygenase reductase subunit